MISYHKRYGKFYKVEGSKTTKITSEEWIEAMKGSSEPEVDPLEALRASATTYESFEDAVEDHGKDDLDRFEDDLISEEKEWT
jgi:hypothetical protein